jgi:hypothetical protein
VSRVVLFLLLIASIAPEVLFANDDGPPIAITSPDKATTFAYGNVKNHVLFWDKKDQLLIARIVFTNSEFNTSSSQDDQHDFRLPGVRFDESKGIFCAVSTKGELIPVAHIKKTLFLKSVEVLPNANVRVEYPHGNVTVILEAISPNDPAMHSPPPGTNPDGTHHMDLDGILH